MLNSVSKLFVAALLSLISLSASALEPAGKIDSMKGDVKALLDGETRTLSKGDQVFPNDQIITEKKSIAEIKFVDDSNFILGPDSEFKIDKFSYNQPDKENSFSTKLVKGTFRFVTGLIARYKPDTMKVSTAVATIGIRGTEVAVEADATSATIVLEPPEDENKKTAIEVSNEFGSVLIDEPGYGTEIPDQFSPPSPARRMRLRTIENVMRSLQNIQRINIPRPVR